MITWFITTIVKNFDCLLLLELLLFVMLLVRLKKSIYAFSHFKPQKASTRISELFGAAEEVGN